MSDTCETTASDRGAILAVGLEHPGHLHQDCTTAESVRAALELLRVLQFDLVVTADRLPDMPVWQFVQRMRSVWPWQKWVLYSSSLSERDEITARTLGVLQIMQGTLDWDAVGQLAANIRSQSRERRPLVPASRNLLRPATTQT
jgi:DNA-binding response OmpR family regulator